MLDLVRHTYEDAREMYADLWLGFSEVDVRRFLAQAGFTGVETSVVHREEEAPHFETMLAVGGEALEVYTEPMRRHFMPPFCSQLSQPFPCVPPPPARGSRNSLPTT